MSTIATDPQNHASRVRRGPDAMPALIDRLRALAEERDTITVEMLIRRIGAQGHAPLLMIAALLMILPIGMIPGVGGALGALVAAIGLQMLLGHRGIWIPDFIGKRGIPADKIARMTERIRPAMEWLRRHMEIRAEVLSSGRASLTIIALLLMVCGGSLGILGAIPIAAPLMGLPIAVFALGLLARDGVVVGVGYALVIAVVAVLLFLRLQVFG